MCKLSNTRYFKHCGLFLLALLFSSGTFAETLLNGVAVHSELGKERFIAGLKVSNPSADAKAILQDLNDKQIQVRILSPRMSARSFKRMWIEGMAINASSSELTKNAQYMADFSNMLKIKLIAGDIFTISRTGDRVIVALDSVKLGEIPNKQFFDLLLRTWVGPVPLSSSFRSNLLAAGDIDPALLARFDSTVPTEQRVAAIQGSVRPVKAPTTTIAAAPAIKAPPVRAPKVATPKAPVVPPVVKAPSAVPQPPKIATAPKPQVSKPVTAKPTPASTPAPTPKPVQTALLNANLLEEDEDDLDFTAESLLAQQLYIAKLKKWTRRYIRYPERALQRGHEGDVRLNVVIDRTGTVKDVIVVEKSKHSTLTKAAIQATNDASPFPKMPEDIQGARFTFTIPFVFRMN